MLATVIVGIAAIVLAAIQTLHRRKVGRDRRSIFADVEPLLTEATVTQDGIGFPTLRGRWNGHAVKIELVVDTLALRQLPTLWMLATVLRPLPVRTPVDITLRPRSSDIVSAGTSFSYEHEAPRGWPEDLRVTTPEPAIPPLEELDGIVELLELPTTKGVLIAPGGVRVVHELARGSIGQYRVVRRPKFAFVLAADRAIALLLAAEEVADRVEAVGAGLGAVRQMRRNGPRGQSLNAARCALVSTVALLGCAVTQGSVRATLAVVWILLLITAVALEWSARRRVRTELAVQASKRSSKARPRNRAR